MTYIALWPIISAWQRLHYVYCEVEWVQEVTLTVKPPHSEDISYRVQLHNLLYVYGHYWFRDGQDMCMCRGCDKCLKSFRPLIKVKILPWCKNCMCSFLWRLLCKLQTFTDLQIVITVCNRRCGQKLQCGDSRKHIIQLPNPTAKYFIQ